MSREAVTAKVRSFYERYPFPGTRPVDQDGLILLRRLTKGVSRRLEGKRSRALRILDAGCGTGHTSVSLARQFPSADIVGIDQSSASLEEARGAAGALGLPNVRFRKWNLMRPLADERPFDLVLCLGVLHHTADMGAALANLRRALRSDGELYLWIYGKHGRYRHSLNMRLLALLQAAGPRGGDPVELARALLGHSAENGAMRDLLGNVRTGALEERAFDDPVWIADQFLHPHETLVEMTELLRLAAGAGLAVVEAVGMNEAAAKRLLPPLLQERFLQVGRHRQWIALDLLLKPERYFVILRRGRSARRS
jgi:SAM-dependent methyltransferase